MNKILLCMFLSSLSMCKSNAMADIKLDGQRIGNAYINDIVPSALSSQDCEKQPFNLMLANNYIDDNCISKLMKILMADGAKFGKNLEILDLSNNRIGLEGAIQLIPLLALGKLKFINLSINMHSEADYKNLYKALQKDKTLQEKSISADEAAAKIVLLPRNYRYKIFFNGCEAFRDAHKIYYNLAD